MRNSEEIYPQKMLRGISSKNFILEGILTEEAFNLDPVREDGYCEISVTWYDNQDAFNVIMAQKSDRRDEIQFKAGVAELDRIEIATKMKAHFLSENLSFLQIKGIFSNKIFLPDLGTFGRIKLAGTSFKL